MKLTVELSHVSMSLIVSQYILSLSPQVSKDLNNGLNMPQKSLNMCLDMPHLDVDRHDDKGGDGLDDERGKDVGQQYGSCR